MAAEIYPIGPQSYPVDEVIAWEQAEVARDMLGRVAEWQPPQPDGAFGGLQRMFNERFHRRRLEETHQKVAAAWERTDHKLERIRLSIETQRALAPELIAFCGGDLTQAHAPVEAMFTDAQEAEAASHLAKAVDIMLAGERRGYHHRGYSLFDSQQPHFVTINGPVVSADHSGRVAASVLSYFGFESRHFSRNVIAEGSTIRATATLPMGTYDANEVALGGLRGNQTPTFQQSLTADYEQRGQDASVILVAHTAPAKRRHSQPRPTHLTLVE